MGASRIIPPAIGAVGRSRSALSRYGRQFGTPMMLMTGRPDTELSEGFGAPGWGPIATSQSDVQALKRGSALYSRRREMRDLSRSKRDVPMGDRYRPDHSGIPYLRVGLRLSGGWSGSDTDSMMFSKELFTTLVWLLHVIGPRLVDVARQYCSRVLYSVEELRAMRPYKRAGGQVFKRRGMLPGRQKILAGRARKALRATGGQRSVGIQGAGSVAKAAQQASFISPRTGWFLAGWQYRVNADAATRSATLYLVNTRRAANGRYLQEYFFRGTSFMIPRPIHAQLMNDLRSRLHMFRPLNVLLAAYGGRRPAPTGTITSTDTAENRSNQVRLRASARSMDKLYGLSSPATFGHLSEYYDPLGHALFSPRRPDALVSTRPLQAAASEAGRTMDYWLQQVVSTSLRFTHPSSFRGMRQAAAAMGSTMVNSRLSLSMDRMVERSSRKTDLEIARGHALRAMRSPVQVALMGGLSNMTLDQFDSMMRKSGLKIDTTVGVRRGYGD